MSKILTKKDLIAKLKLLDLTPEQKPKIVCSLIGHSKIIEIDFGYVYCARCGQQLGDTLVGVYECKNKVIMNHDCPTCHANYDKLTWKDKFMVTNPFSKYETTSR